MPDLVECKGCYEEFERRTDQPKLEICLRCAPTLDALADWHCPGCGWNCECVMGLPDAPVEYSPETPDWEYGYCGGVHWTETWTCPECATQWDFNNSNV
jgi:hypothetical protein